VRRSAAIGAIARQLALSAATVEVVEALERQGIRTIMLRGEAIAARLYEASEARVSADVDLLVESASFGRAEEILEQLGYRDKLAGARPNELFAHANTWLREAPILAIVDLHTSLYWCSEDPGAVWGALSENTRRLHLGTKSIEVLSDAGQAFVIAIHLVQHGDGGKPRADLSRALERYDRSVWLEAAAIASRLNAEGVFAAGLASDERGRVLVEELQLSGETTAEMRLRIAGDPPVSVGVLRFAQADSMRVRAILLAGKLFPSRAFMRDWSPFGARSRASLLLAYAYRPVWLLRRLPRAVDAWRRSNRVGGQRRVPARALSPEHWRAAWWTLGAVRRVRRGLRAHGVAAAQVPAAPEAVCAHRATTKLVLSLSRTTCLESALVRQALDAGAGRPRELVIGVTGAREGFRAHAWLEGDGVGEDFKELMRHAPREG
jgi:hypothetical protein